MTRTRRPASPLLLLASGLLALGGCAPPAGPQPPRLLTPAEIAALSAPPERAAPDAGLGARAAALGARAAALRAARATGGEALRRRAAALEERRTLLRRAIAPEPPSG